ncbi:MAG: hypothetical protein AAF316_11075 [Cyanobacteria bacterium P01_A01_bin.80]
MVKKLRRQAHNGKLRIQENTQIVGAEWINNQWLVKFTDGTQGRFHRICFATKLD